MATTLPTAGPASLIQFELTSLLAALGEAQCLQVHEALRSWTPRLGIFCSPLTS